VTRTAVTARCARLRLACDRHGSARLPSGFQVAGNIGSLGFAGTAAKPTPAAAGLAVRAGDWYVSAPTVPMLPATWKPDGNLAEP